MCFLLHRFFFLHLKDSRQQWNLDLAVHPEPETQAILVTSSFISFLTLLLWPPTRAFLTWYIQKFYRQSPECFSSHVLTLVSPPPHQLSIRLDTFHPIPDLFLAPSSLENTWVLLHLKKADGLLERKTTVHIFKSMVSDMLSWCKTLPFYYHLCVLHCKCPSVLIFVSNAHSTNMRITELTGGLKHLMILPRSVLKNQTYICQ